eukprot:g32243.t1
MDRLCQVKEAGLRGRTPEAEYEVLLLHFLGGVIVTQEAAQGGQVTQGVGGGAEVVGDRKVLFVTIRVQVLYKVDSEPLLSLTNVEEAILGAVDAIDHISGCAGEPLSDVKGLFGASDGGENIEGNVSKFVDVTKIVGVTFEYSDIMLRLFKTLVRPLLEYCVQFWSPCYMKDSIKLEREDIDRILPELEGLSYKQRMDRLGLFSLKHGRLKGDLIDVYKIMRCIDKRVVHMRNELPEEAVDVGIVTMFKRHLDMYMNRKALSIARYFCCFP